MYSIYRLKADELDDGFLESLRVLFKGKEIEIAVSAVQNDNEEENQVSFYESLEQELQRNSLN